ncbi:TetR/AcrR family transcriptional regulator [Mycolicibacterium sp.]|uniref:TetR/AcrR family transcriptional regulator n=1 Tax=Mycolicibacterium sp. TaxID=2320850 RepID=UPI00093CF873|nr:hypothetical protein EB73_39300 [Mycobacterium sp. SWH-M3]
MTTEPRRRPGGRSARVRQSVIEATVAVIAEKGLTDFTVNDVAARAGVHATSIYRRWGTRDNLITDTLLDYSRHTIPVPDTGSVRADLYRLLTAIAAYLNTSIGRALAQALATGGDESRWQTVRFEFWTTRLALTRTIVDRAVERGELPPETDARLVLEMLVAPLQFRTLVTREQFGEELCTRLTDAVLDGLRPRPHVAD